jgi:hypothetical protein
MQNEDRNVLPSQPVDCSRSDVTTGCTDHCKMVPIPASLALVAPEEEAFEEVTKQL